MASPPTLQGPALVALPARIAAALSGQPQPLVPPFTPGVTNATPRYLKLSAEGDVSSRRSGQGREKGRRERLVAIFPSIDRRSIAAAAAPVNFQ